MTETSIDHAAEAWRVVKELREEFIGRPRQPTDDDWRQAIEAGFTRLASGKSKRAAPGEGTAEYERGYEDACCDIEIARDNQKHDRQRKKRQAAIVKAA